MCGFFSLIKKKKFIESKRFDVSSSLIKNRGPDDSKFYRSKNLLSKFYRLSIQDLSKKGMQPMVYNNRYVLVYNGEIYNFKELASKFNFNLKSKSDTEETSNLLIKKGKDTQNILKVCLVFSFMMKKQKGLNL